MSCDELYVDCGDVVADTGASALEFAALLRQEILEKTGCTASAGLGTASLVLNFITLCVLPLKFYLQRAACLKFHLGSFCTFEYSLAFTR